MRTAEERDRQTLVVVRALVRFCAVVAGLLCALAAADLAIGVDENLHAALLLLTLLAGAAAAVAPLRRSGRRPGLS